MNQRLWGLINGVVPATELRPTTRKFAERIAEASPLVVDLGKQAYYQQIGLEQAQAHSYAQEVMTENALTVDVQEGMAAFLEKRHLLVWELKSSRNAWTCSTNLWLFSS